MSNSSKPVANLSSAPVWQDILRQREAWSRPSLRERFAQDPKRFEHMSQSACGILLDYSKNRLDGDALSALLKLAEQCGVESLRDTLFNGSVINTTEQRAVLHTALRTTIPGVTPPQVIQQVTDTLKRVAKFVEAVRSGSWRGATGMAITHVIHIGIGGSDLGPRLVCDALSPFAQGGPELRFVSNVDARDLQAALKGCEAGSTLFVIASKTFTTLETMMNAQSARAWALAHGIAEDALHQHFVAISTNLEAGRAFGINPDNMFPLWDWVGGRFSLWSSIGLPIALQNGMEQFDALRAGAAAMDQHFREAPLERNLPVLLAMIGIWNINVLECPSVSNAPYHQFLRLLPAFLQQLEMESTGKSVDHDGQPVNHATAALVWGQAGTNGQHAYFQWLHQGHEWAAVDFIAVAQAPHGDVDHQTALLANCLAQSRALMLGKTRAEAEAEMLAAGLAPDEARRLAGHRAFPGNRPSNTLLLPQLDAWHLGALLALYEHKVSVQGQVWGINAYDQWGVELGKQLAREIMDALQADAGGSKEPQPARRDASTQGLIEAIQGMRQ